MVAHAEGTEHLVGVAGPSLDHLADGRERERRRRVEVGVEVDRRCRWCRGAAGPPRGRRSRSRYRKRAAACSSSARRMAPAIGRTRSGRMEPADPVRASEHDAHGDAVRAERAAGCRPGDAVVYSFERIAVRESTTCPVTITSTAIINAGETASPAIGVERPSTSLPMYLVCELVVM